MIRTYTVLYEIRGRRRVWLGLYRDQADAALAAGEVHQLGAGEYSLAPLLVDPSLIGDSLPSDPGRDQSPVDLNDRLREVTRTLTLTRPEVLGAIALMASTEHEHDGVTEHAMVVIDRFVHDLRQQLRQPAPAAGSES